MSRDRSGNLPDEVPSPEEMADEGVAIEVDKTDFPNDNPVYDIVPIVRNSSIHPGDTVEIEVYFHGSGPVSTNKFQIVSDSEILDDDQSGNILLNIKSGDGGQAIDRMTGEKTDITGKMVFGGPGVSRTHTIDQRGLIAILDPGFFWPINRGSNAYPQVASELAPSGDPPILAKLNTKDNAAPGDYDVAFSFTYGTQSANQAHEKVTIHIEDWTERHKQALRFTGVIVGTIIAVISLLLTLI